MWLTTEAEDTARQTQALAAKYYAMAMHRASLGHRWDAVIAQRIEDAMDQLRRLIDVAQ